MDLSGNGVSENLIEFLIQRTFCRKCPLSSEIIGCGKTGLGNGAQKLCGDEGGSAGQEKGSWSVREIAVME